MSRTVVNCENMSTCQHQAPTALVESLHEKQTEVKKLSGPCGRSAATLAAVDPRLPSQQNCKAHQQQPATDVNLEVSGRGQPEGQARGNES